MPLRTLPETVDKYQVQVDEGEVLSRHRYKEMRILLINTDCSLLLSGSSTKIRRSYSYVFFSIVCYFLLQ